jgi:hypothetical protein
MNPCINIFLQPILLMGLLGDNMKVLFFKNYLANEGSDTYALPANTLKNIGDRVVLRIVGTVNDADDQFIPTLTFLSGNLMGTSELFGTKMFDGKLDANWAFVCEIVLVGTYQLKVSGFFTMTSDDTGTGDGSSFVWSKYVETYFETDEDLTLSFDHLDGNTQFDLKHAEMFFFDGTTQQNFQTPTTLAYNSGTDTLSWAFNFPSPGQWAVEKSIDGGVNWTLAFTDAVGTDRATIGILANIGHGNYVRVTPKFDALVAGFPSDKLLIP